MSIGTNKMVATVYLIGSYLFSKLKFSMINHGVQNMLFNFNFLLCFFIQNTRDDVYIASFSEWRAQFLPSYMPMLLIDQKKFKL